MTPGLFEASVANDPITFARLASAPNGIQAIDALYAAVVPDHRRAAIDGQLSGVIADLVAWLKREGPGAGWATARWCRDAARREIAGVERRQHELSIRYRFRAYVQCYGRRVEAPWLWVELMCAVPADRDELVGQLAAFETRFGARAQKPLVEALRANAGHHRVLLALLGRTGLSKRAIEEHLRGALPEPADAPNEEMLLAQLRNRPNDPALATVWADLLIARGDPRGELVQIEVAIGNASPERALELSAQHRMLCEQQRKAIWNKPGGVPFRDRYRGRSYIRFSSSGGQALRGNLTAALSRRVRRFVAQVTDVLAPSTILTATRREDIAAALGEATLELHPQTISRADPTRPIADEDAFWQLCSTLAPKLVFRFRLAWPGTRIPLPYQDRSHYARGAAFPSSLSIGLEERVVELELAFPFEDVDDPGFTHIYDAICATLGRVLTPSRFSHVHPSVDGKRMVVRKIAFERGG